MRESGSGIVSSSRLLQRQRDLPWWGYATLALVAIAFLIISRFSGGGECLTDDECRRDGKAMVCAERKRKNEPESDGSWPSYGTCSDAPPCGKQRPCWNGRICAAGRCMYETKRDPGFAPKNDS